MTILEVLLIAVGLSMDAVAVSMTNGMVYKKISGLKCVVIPLFFGVFQGIMPFCGYLAGGIFAEIIAKYAGFVIFIILFLIGGKMVKDGVLGRRLSHQNEPTAPDLTWLALFFQAIATSIDAFAVGIGFSAAHVAILQAATLIAVTTALMSALALLIGRKSGDLLGTKAEILGGIILIIIGIKAVL